MKPSKQARILALVRQAMSASRFNVKAEHAEEAPRKAQRALLQALTEEMDRAEYAMLIWLAVAISGVDRLNAWRRKRKAERAARQAAVVVGEVGDT